MLKNYLNSFSEIFYGQTKSTRLSLSQATAAPAMAMEPSRAYTGLGEGRKRENSENILSIPILMALFKSAPTVHSAQEEGEKR